MSAAKKLTTEAKVPKSYPGKAANTNVRRMPPPPDVVFDVGGVLGLMMDHADAGAIRAQPFITLGAVLAAVGALAGRRYASETDLRTNLNVVGLALSGSGKDWPMKCISKILVAAGLDHYEGGGDLSSGQSVYTALKRHPCQLFQFDEYGQFIKAALGHKAPGYVQSIVTAFTKLATSAPDIMKGKEYAKQDGNQGRPREDIHQPHACIFGNTVASTLWDAMKSSGLLDGSFARSLYFQSPENYPDSRLSIRRGPPPADLVAGVRAIAAGVPGHGGGLALAEHVSYASMDPYVVPYGIGVAEDVARVVQDEDQRLRAAGHVPCAVPGTNEGEHHQGRHDPRYQPASGKPDYVPRGYRVGDYPRSLLRRYRTSRNRRRCGGRQG